MHAKSLRLQLLTAVAIVSLIASSASADPISVTLNPADTQITFLLGATGHDVEGTLYLREGHLELGTDGQASGRLVIDAIKTQTGSKKRDKTMHAKVLESVAHPLISYTVDGFEGRLPESGDGTITLKGRMSLVGQEHEMTLPIQLSVTGDSYSGSSAFDVPYIEWGLHDPSILFLRVEKTVQVHVKTRGKLELGTATGNEH